MKDISEYTNDLYKRIDEKTEALGESRRVKPWMKWAAAAAAFVLVVAGALVALNVAGAWRSGGVADPNGSGDEHSGVIISSDSGSVGSEDGSDSTYSGVYYPPVPASDRPQTDPTPPDQSEAHGGDDRKRLTNYKYLDDRLTTINETWRDLILDQTGKDVMVLWDTKEWYDDNGIGFSLIEIIDELNVSKENFIEMNNKEQGKINVNIRENGLLSGFSTEEEMIYYYCFTDEEIDIIYSGDKKRIAEAFANPYAVIADDWEIYPLRWIIDNPATLYKEKHISLDALETAAHKLIDQGESQISDEDSAAILARIEEYKNIQ